MNGGASNGKGNLNVPAHELPPDEAAHHNKDDFRSSMSWRVFRMMAELIDGFEFIAGFKKSVTIFGSARVLPEGKWYQEAQKLGRLLAKEGFAVVTGGGPGIMEAGNRGAVEGEGISVGLNIQLPHEQRMNPFVRKMMGFHYFFTRKVMLTYAARVYVYFPGGFGTLDEFFEIATLIQERKIADRIPVILVGKDYWGPFTDWVRHHTYREQFIAREDMDIYAVVDTAEEAMAIIRNAPPRHEEF